MRGKEIGGDEGRKIETDRDTDRETDRQRQPDGRLKD